MEYDIGVRLDAILGRITEVEKALMAILERFKMAEDAAAQVQGGKK